jgi:hypothetical protein
MASNETIPALDQSYGAAHVIRRLVQRRDPRGEAEALFEPKCVAAAAHVGDG